MLSKVKSFFGKTNYSDEELSAISLDKLEEMCFSKNIVQACNYAGKKSALVTSPDKNWYKAERLFQKGCDNNNVSSCNLLGELYSLKVIQGKDEKDSEQFFLKGCNQKDPTSCYKLANYYDSQKDSSNFNKYKDITINLTKERCDKKEDEMCSILGQILNNEDASEAEKNKARTLLEPSCDKGDANSCYEIGKTKALDELKTEEGEKYLEKSCIMGSIEGCELFTLPTLIIYEITGEVKGTSIEQLIDLNKKSCNLNSGTGCYVVGRLLSDNNSQYKDKKNGIKFLSYSCELSTPAACYHH